jgi:hypothetical protein
LQPDRGGGLLHLAQCELGAPSVGRIEEHRNTNGLGHEVVQELQPLGHDLPGEKIDAGRVAARAGEASDKANLDRLSFPHSLTHRGFVLPAVVGGAYLLCSSAPAAGRQISARSS